MASTDITWTRGGCLSSWSAPLVKKVTWDVYQLLCDLQKQRLKSEGRGLKSEDFTFAGATWNLFISNKLFESKNRYQNTYFTSVFQLGINVLKPSDAMLAGFCKISFENTYGETFNRNRMEPTRFKFENDECISKEICSFNGDDRTFLEDCAFIVCEISVKKLIKKASSQAEISHSNGNNSVEAPTQIELPENEEEALSTTSFDGKLCQDLKNLLLSKEFSDVTIKIGDQQFRAHWFILAARSPVFASMLRHDTKEKTTGVVDVEDCELASFPVFLEFLYCESTEKISSENVFNLYKSADKYDVQDLKRKCLEFMTTNLSVNTFCETIRLCLQHSEKKLLKLSTEFFIRNFQEIILTPKWQAFILENPIQGNELFIKAAKTFK